MNKWIIIVGVFFILAGAVAFINTQNNKNSTPPPSQLTSTPTPTPVNIKASFVITTGNITRSFNAEKYHNRSADVFITSQDPSQVQVKKEGITWNDFFSTLPMKLTKECLTTGDGENLCSSNGSLKFYINEKETPEALDLIIKDKDNLKVVFTY